MLYLSVDLECSQATSIVETVSGDSAPSSKAIFKHRYIQEFDSLLIHSCPIELFWSHIHRRAIVVGDSQAGFGGVLDPADAEVSYLGATMLVQQNVAGLQIPVDDARVEVG